MRKILLIGLGVTALTVLLSVITASLMAAPLPGDVGLQAAVASSHHLVRLPDGTIGLLYYNVEGADYNVLYITSSDNGVTWTDPDTLNAAPYVLMKEPPDVMAAPNGDVFAVWDASTNAGDPEATDIYFAYRDYATGLWSGEVMVAPGQPAATGARIAMSPDRVLHVVYYDEGDSTSEVYYSRNDLEFAVTGRPRSGNGAFWSFPVAVDDTDEYAQNAALVADPHGGVHVFYCSVNDITTTDFLADQLRYVHSTDQGLSWSSSEEVTEHGSVPSDFGVQRPTCVAVDSTVHVVWLDDDGAGRDLYHAARNPAGAWSAPFNVTTADSSEDIPSLAANVAGRLDLCYEALPAGGTKKDIFHRHMNPGEAWSGAENVSQTAGTQSLAPGIVAEPARHGFMAAWVEPSSGGDFQIFFRLSDDEVWPGDGNNDGTVDADDVLPLVSYWTYVGPARADATSTWSIHRVASWDPWQAGFADANGDGVVDARDVLPIGLNWGRTHAVTRPAGAPALASLDPAAFRAAAAEVRAALGGDAATGHAAEMVAVIDRALRQLDGTADPAALTPAGLVAATPNPASGEVRIRYRLTSEGPVRVEVYDTQGRRVRTVLSAVRAAGDGEAVWNGRDERDVPAPAGLYLVRITSAEGTSAAKLLRVR